MATLNRKTRSIIRRTAQRLDSGSFHEEWGGMSQTGENTTYGTSSAGRRTAEPSKESRAERDARYRNMLESLYPKRLN